MIEYFYTGDYDLHPSVENETEPFSVLELHAKVFALADKYDAHHLRKRAVDHYKHRLEECDADEFLASIATIYQATGPTIRSLKDIAVEHAQTQLQRVARRQEDVRRTFSETVEAVPALARDMCGAWIGGRTRGSCRDRGSGQPLEILQARCMSCGRGGASAYQ